MAAEPVVIVLNAEAHAYVRLECSHFAPFGVALVVSNGAQITYRRLAPAHARQIAAGLLALADHAEHDSRALECALG